MSVGGMGQQTRWLSAAQPLTASPVSARIAFETTLPQGCTDASGVATCQTMSGWPEVAPTSPVAGFCSAAQTAEVDFVLPPTGDLTVGVQGMVSACG